MVIYGILQMRRVMRQTGIKIFGSILAVFFIGCAFFSVHPHVSAITATQYTCQVNGSYLSPTTGSAALTVNDQTRSTAAMNWLTAMTSTRTTVTTASTISPSIEFAKTYTGPISGTFVLSGASYPVKNDASIEVDSPSTVPDTYAGVISGKVLTTPTPNRWIIQVYKLTGSGEVQIAKQALADGTNGTFSIDLSTVLSPPTGKWELGILDADASYAEYGTKWPSPDYYDGLEVQQKVITDTIYDWSTTHALADGTFSFPDSQNGKKLFRLVDTASGDVLAEHVVTTGMIRSFELDPSDPAYGTAFADQSYVYDQALALFSAIGTDNESLADTLATGLLNFQETTGALTGGFVFSAPQLSPSYRDAQIRSGAHAIATDALLSYIAKYPNTPGIATYQAAAQSALTFIDGLLSSSGTTNGLYLGGYGDYSGAGGAFNPSVVIPWASTEHNIDIWQTFMEASKVFGNNTVNYMQKAATLNTAIVSKLYSTSENRYYQGMQLSGPDTSDPLDVNTWGAMQMYSSGRYNQALQTLNRLDLFKFTSQGVTGYEPFYDSAGYPGAVPTVWFEGSYGAALAQYRVGNYDAYRTLLDGLAVGQQSDGSFQYATNEDSNYGISTRKAVSSTAWYVLATTGRSAIWNVCLYAPPTDPIIIPTDPIITKPSGITNSTDSRAMSTNTPSEGPIIADTTTPTKISDGVKNTNTVHENATRSTSFWTPVVIIGSSVVGLGILWALVALIRLRLG
jgi:hypothetical protein